MANTKVLRIGRFELILPADHLLEVYQKRFKLYDWILGEVARVVAGKYTDATVVDIGANVGDTAAVICRHGDLPVLCIEGHPSFIAFLRYNLPRLPRGIEVAECLIGQTSGTVSRDALIEDGGTARVSDAVTAAQGGAQLPVRRLSEVLSEHPRFATPRLIKIDTDGADFEIISSSMDVIAKSHPVLYFEYSLAERKDSLPASIAAISRLSEAAYSRFLVYDNFGNLLHVISSDVVHNFMDLNRYLMSNLLFGRAVYYCDVCAFTANDEDLAEGLYRYQSQLVNDAIKRGGWQL